MFYKIQVCQKAGLLFQSCGVNRCLLLRTKKYIQMYDYYYMICFQTSFVTCTKFTIVDNCREVRVSMQKNVKINP